MNFTCSWSLPNVLAMKCSVGSSICISRQPASRSARSSLFMASAMSQMTSRLSLYFGVWMSRKSPITCEQHVPKRTGFARLALRDAPDLRVVERPVLDLVHDVRPAPGGVDLVEQRARRIVQPRRASFLRAAGGPLEAGPALQRVVVPGAARHVLVAVEVAVRDEVEPRALLVADDDGHRVLEFLAEADVQHAGVERLAPHADVEPAGPRPGAGDGAWQGEVGGRGEHGESVYSFRVHESTLVRPALLVLLLALGLALPALAQRGRRFGFGFMPSSAAPIKYDGRFVIVRLWYQGHPGWSFDYPDMEQNFTAILSNLSRLPAHPGSNIFRMDDPDLLNFRVAELSEPG